jgi:hypothetical protein
MNQAACFRAVSSLAHEISDSRTSSVSLVAERPSDCRKGASLIEKNVPPVVLKWPPPTNRNEVQNHSVQNTGMEDPRPQSLPPGPGEPIAPAPITTPGTPAVAPPAFGNVEVIKAAVPKISAVRFSKEQFMALSPAERELFIRVGIAQNDLMVTSRLWGAHLFRQPPISKVALDAHVIQQMTTLFLFLGKLFEAIRVFETRFQRTLLSTEYQKHFNPKQLAAVRTLNAANGKSGLWAAIRNSFCVPSP